MFRAREAGWVLVAGLRDVLAAPRVAAGLAAALTTRLGVVLTRRGARGARGAAGRLRRSGLGGRGLGSRGLDGRALGGGRLVLGSAHADAPFSSGRCGRRLAFSSTNERYISARAVRWRAVSWASSSIAASTLLGAGASTFGRVGLDRLGRQVQAGGDRRQHGARRAAQAALDLGQVGVRDAHRARRTGSA